MIIFYFISFILHSVSNLLLLLALSLLLGPYGLPTIDLTSGYYKVYILVAGGIGITPLKSIYNNLINKYQKNPNYLKKCIFIWSVKDHSLISSMSESISLPNNNIDSYSLNKNDGNIINDEHDKFDKSTALSKSNTVVNQPGVRDESVIEEGYTSNPMFRRNDFNNDNINGLEINHNNVNNSSDYNIESRVNIENNDIDMNDNITFHNRFYITKIESSNNENNSDKPNNQKDENRYKLSHGRPQLLNIFEQISSYCVHENISNVGVSK